MHGLDLTTLDILSLSGIALVNILGISTAFRLTSIHNNTHVRLTRVEARNEVLQTLLTTALARNVSDAQALGFTQHADDAASVSTKARP